MKPSLLESLYAVSVSARNSRAVTSPPFPENVQRNYPIAPGMQAPSRINPNTRSVEN